MAPEMAREIVKQYQLTGYNATQAAKNAGYSDITASQHGYSIVSRATQRLAEAAAKNKINPLPNETDTILEAMGLTPIDVITEYLKLLGQDKDLSTKHKALAPLMKSIHTGFSEEQQQQTSPVNITVERLNVDNKGDSNDVAQYSFRDTIRDIAVDDSPSNDTTQAPVDPATE